MTDRELENRLAQALEHAAPDDLEGVLSRCAPREGNVIQMTEKTNKTGNKKNWGRALIAACLALVLVGGGGGLYYQQAHAVASVVSLDVNPSIELTVNRSEKVLSCTPMNQDGAVVLFDMGGGADLEGTKLDVAVNAIVGSMLRNGYLDKLSSAILVSVEDDDQARAQRIQEELVAVVDSILQGANNASNVYSQNFTTDALPAQNDAQWVPNVPISSGKAALVRRVMEMNGTISTNSTTALDALSALSVEELMDLLETNETRIPIGMSAAMTAAEEYAGTAAMDSVTADVDPELDDPRPHYEVELRYAGREYEYRVDAFTGEVFSGQKDILNADQTGTQTPAPAPQTPSAGTQTAPSGQTPSTGTQAADIGAEAAKTAALKHAGVSASDAAYITAKKDYDDGRQEYDVEFYAGGWKYEYEIAAADGTVLKSEKERDDLGVIGGAEGQTGLQAAIGQEAAFNAAAEYHAAQFPELAGYNLLNNKTEYDRDDGVYEVEFWCAGEEFDYTVDAFTGKVLGWDTDYRTPVTPAPADPAPSTGHHDDDHHTQTQQPAQTADIGLEAAKQAALAHAGLTADQVTKLKAELDRDDGRLEYEVEFKSGGYEYEYTLDAATGAILKSEKDWDD